MSYSFIAETLQTFLQLNKDQTGICKEEQFLRKTFWFNLFYIKIISLFITTKSYNALQIGK